jgi:hypothetical protein
LTNLIASLRLPQNELSRAIIAFARFFSLPLEPKLLNSLKREALAGQARALAAAAAADKGIALTGEALREYAAAIEGTGIPEKKDPSEVHRLSENSRGNGDSEEKSPPDGGSADGGSPDSGSSDHPGQGASGGDFSGNRGKSGGFPDNGENARERAEGAPEDLRRRIGAVLKEKPLLDLLNRLPGKSGRRWVVLPFSFSAGGLEFTVSLRLFLNRNPSLSGVPAASGYCERLCADITVSPPESASQGSESKTNWEGRRWIITLERPNSATGIRAEVSLFSGAGGEASQRSAVIPPKEKKRLEAELAETLGLPAGRVAVKEKVPPFSDSRDDTLKPIDEEV